MVTVVKIQQTDNYCTQYCWPFPAECPPKPWTPEQIKEHQRQQRQQTPDAPMISK